MKHKSSLFPFDLRRLILRLGLIALLLFAAAGPASLWTIALAQGSGSNNPGSGNKDDKDKEKEKREREERERREREEREKREREERERRQREEERRKEEERRRQNNPQPANPQPNNPGSGTSNPNPGNSGSGNSGSGIRSYYAQVTINASGQVLCGDIKVQSDSPWLKLAAPGMWLEASGSWDGNTFKAEEVKLHSPQAWAFYQGPASLVGANQYQFVSAWLSTNRSDPFIALRAAPEQAQVRVIAYFDGSKLRAMPANFPAPPAGAKVGWIELTGTLSGSTLVWQSVKTFP